MIYSHDARESGDYKNNLKFTNTLLEVERDSKLLDKEFKANMKQHNANRDSKGNINLTI